MTRIHGVWLPAITPFRDGTIDFVSYARVLERALAGGVTGIFPLGTTGESPTIEDDELEAVVDKTIEIVAGRAPVFVGVGGNATTKVTKALRRFEHHDIAGFVSVCPYYNRPSQDGLREHFLRLSD